ncbi:Catabolite repression protein creC [Porphyridium purpureum]|uniref:Catabolite repression protein creC n=1 Tax=Porphyridium purpureum TaxID=35688 RepID=A0A5J4YZ43_PORPP|nr:Catabolite repression protein creC [Porphyridium purpureum]|eukprot:POR0736..scf208_2
MQSPAKAIRDHFEVSDELRFELTAEFSVETLLQASGAAGGGSVSSSATTHLPGSVGHAATAAAAAGTTPSHPAKTSSAPSVPAKYTDWSPLYMKRDTLLRGTNVFMTGTSPQPALTGAAPGTTLQITLPEEGLQAVDDSPRVTSPTKPSLLKKLGTSLTRLGHSRNASADRALHGKEGALTVELDRENSRKAKHAQQQQLLLHSQQLLQEQEQLQHHAEQTTTRPAPVPACRILAPLGAQAVSLLDIRSLPSTALRNGGETDTVSVGQSSVSSTAPRLFHAHKLVTPCKHPVTVSAVCFDSSRNDPCTHILAGCTNGEIHLYSVQTIDLVGSAALATSARGNGGALQPSTTQSGSSFISSACFNRDGAISFGRVIGVQWIASAPHRFIAVFMDGTVALYDSKLKASVTGLGTARSSSVVLSAVASEPVSTGGAGNGDPDDSAQLTAALALGTSGTALKQHEVHVWKIVPKTHKKGNPLQALTIGCGAINAMHVSSAGPHAGFLALACRDGYLRVVDTVRACVLLAFRSMYGAFLCVKWSPCGNFLLAGGQDDCIGVYSVSGRAQLARFEGHSSWVSALDFLPSTPSAISPGISSRTPENSLPHPEPSCLRVVSGAQDCKLLFWELDHSLIAARLKVLTKKRLDSSGESMTDSFGRLPVPSTAPQQPGATNSIAAPPVAGAATSSRIPGTAITNLLSRAHHRSSEGSSASDPVERGGSSNSAPNAPVSQAYSPQGESGDIPRLHIVDATPLSEILRVEPVATHYAHAEPITDVYFDADGVFSADANGVVKFWRMATLPPRLRLF